MEQAQQEINETMQVNIEKSKLYDLVNYYENDQEFQLFVKVQNGARKYKEYSDIAKALSPKQPKTPNIPETAK